MNKGGGNSDKGMNLFLPATIDEIVGFLFGKYLLFSK